VYNPVALIDKEHNIHSFLVTVAAKLPELSSDAEGVEHLVGRFVGQYLPVLLRARSKEDSDHAWLAFWSYLVAPRTNRKPFGLSSRTADLLIAEFQAALAEPNR